MCKNKDFDRITHNIYIVRDKKINIKEKNMTKKPKKAKKIIPDDIKIIWVNIIEPLY